MSAATEVGPAPQGILRGVVCRGTALLSSLAAVRERFGTIALLRAFAARLGARFCGLVVAHVVWLDIGEVLATAASAPGFCFKELTPAELAEYARDPSNDLEPEVVNRAGDGRNICYAALDGPRLAAYGWYARESIEAEHCFGFELALPSDVAYMYKGYTHPDYRGLRLHGITMGLALKHLSHNGVQSLISTVNWTNDASLRSCGRSGYRRMGQLIRCRVGRWEPHLVTAKARRQGVQVLHPGRTHQLTLLES